MVSRNGTFVLSMIISVFLFQAPIVYNTKNDIVPVVTFHSRGDLSISTRYDSFVGNPVSPQNIFLPIVAKSKDNFIAYIGYDHNIWIIRPDGTGKRQLTTDAKSSKYLYDMESGYSQLRWSPDGQFLGAVRRDGTNSAILMINITSYQITTLISGVQGTYDWLPDNNAIIFADGPYEPYDAGNYPSGLSTFNILTRQVTKFLSPEPGYRLVSPDWAPMGNAGYFSVEPVPRPMGIWEPDTGFWSTGSSSYQILPSVGALECSWATDGLRMLCTNYYGEGHDVVLWMFNNSGQVIGYVPSGQVSGYAAKQAWSRDGIWIAYRRDPLYTSAPVYIDIQKLENGSWFQYKRIYQDVFPMAWSLDNQHLLVEDQYSTSGSPRFLILDIETSNTVQLFQGIEATWQPY